MEKININEIDKDIYDEVLSLSDRFCISSHVLNNLIYDAKSSNRLINELRTQYNISNLKNLLNKKEFIKIAKLFKRHEINYVFLKAQQLIF